jgi:hypothetical protein
LATMPHAFLRSPISFSGAETATPNKKKKSPLPFPA